MTLAFASDFDRTLFFRDEPGGFKPADMAAISAFQQAGNCFGVSTGRSLRGVLDETRGRVRFDFFSLATGALILDGRQRVIRRSVVRPATVQHLIDEVDSLGPLVIHANDTVYSFGDPLPMQTHIDHLSEVGENLYGLSVWVGEERADKLARTINNRYGAELSSYPNRGIVDVVPRGCSKGEAVRIVRERLGADRIGAMGDSYNDAPMFGPADASFTFADSPVEVREQASQVVGGIAEALSEFSSEVAL